MVSLIGSFIVNFLIIFIAICLFFLPFIAIFWYRNRVEINEKKPHFNYFMEKFFHSTESNVLIAIWAFAESIIWFVIPEFLLILMMFMKVRRKIQLVIYDVIGTVIGTIVAILIHLPEHTLLKIPYIYKKMIIDVHHWYTEHGIFGIFFQPFSGVPYKVFNALALDYNFFIPLFIILAIVARMVRYIVVYELTKAFYPFFHKFVKKHYAILFVFAIAIFTFLLMRVSNTYS